MNLRAFSALEVFSQEPAQPARAALARGQPAAECALRRWRAGCCVAPNLARDQRAAPTGDTELHCAKTRRLECVRRARPGACPRRGLATNLAAPSSAPGG